MFRERGKIGWEKKEARESEVMREEERDRKIKGLSELREGEREEDCTVRQRGGEREDRRRGGRRG